MNADAEIARAIDDLADPDPRAADAAGRSVLARGAAAVAPLLAAFADVPVAARRRVVFLLGELVDEPDADAAAIRGALLSALADDDWKVRKNAAIALGKAGDGAALDALLDRLDAAVETDARVRPSVMLAAGKLAGPADAARIAAVAAESAEECAALAKVADRLGALGDDTPLIALDVPVTRDVTLELWCRAGVADIVVGELAERGLAARVVGPDRVVVDTATELRAVAAVRSALHPVLTGDGAQARGAASGARAGGALSGDAPARNAAALGRALDSSAIAREMNRLTLAGVVRYRLRVDVPIEPFRRRRDWIAAFAAECGDLVNVATGYAWEVVVRGSRLPYVIAARPTAFADERFAYRKRDVPASVHPTLAAAAVRLLETDGADTVIDPFCGSGTLLAERALRAPYRRLVGYDVDARALDAAGENLAPFANVELRSADILRLRERFAADAIVTNPPFGQRVGSPRHARRLHAALDAFALASLRPGGTLVAFRPPDFPSPAGLDVTRRSRVDAGGIAVDLLVARKPLG